jgi:hypothetical protein
MNVAKFDNSEPTVGLKLSTCDYSNLHNQFLNSAKFDNSEPTVGFKLSTSILYRQPAYVLKTTG